MCKLTTLDSEVKTQMTDADCQSNTKEYSRDIGENEQLDYAWIKYNA